MTRTSRLIVLAFGFLVAGWAPGGAVEAASASFSPSAAVTAPEAIASYTRAAGRVFRGRCIEARDTMVALGGGRLPATLYVFEVVDGLKGVVGERVEFQQIGRRDGGVQDLGSRVGLPIYTLGEEYVLFLLPASAAGLTSPAGAAEGVFALEGETLQPLATGHGWRLRGGENPSGVAAGASRTVSSKSSRPSMASDGAGESPALDYASLRRMVLAEGAR